MTIVCPDLIKYFINPIILKNVINDYLHINRLVEITFTEILYNDSQEWIDYK